MSQQAPPPTTRGSVRTGKTAPASTTMKKGTIVARPTGSRAVVRANSPSTAPQGTATTRTYGDIVDSDEVHDEIRALGKEVSAAIHTYLPQSGTNEAQTVAAVRQFGPSKASRKMLNKENEAAVLAYNTHTYAVWRCVADRVGGAYLQQPAYAGRGGDGDRMTHGYGKMLSGANDDFCTRLGYRHVCFCGHNLASHASLTADAAPPVCEERGCACRGFRYIPNCPEEIGEAWLSRRKGFDPQQWSAKCRCGHGCKQHEADRGMRCRDCGCGQFASHFLCLVCDQPWEAHETVFESEAARLRAGRPVREAYFPLSGVDWDVRELVLKDATGGGALLPPAPGAARIAASSTAPRRMGSKTQPTTTRATGRGKSLGGQQVAEVDSHNVVEVVGEDAGEVLPPYCTACATVFRSPESNFCSKCGQTRRR